MSKLAAIVLIIGSVLFLIAAFLPITAAFVAERDIAQLQSSPVEWAVSNLVFAVGSILVVVALALFTLQLRDTSAAFPGYLGLAMIALGTLCWVTILYYRVTLPLQAVFQTPTFGWLFIVYTLLIQAALVAYGFAFLRAGYPRWMGLGSIILSALLFIAYLIFKDVPPFAYYVITLAIGVGLTIGRD